MWRVNLTESAKVVCHFRGCDKSFCKPSHLKQHQRMHTGEVGAVGLCMPTVTDQGHGLNADLQIFGYADPP